MAASKNEQLVTVFCSLPAGFVFDLPSGKKLHIKGMPVSKLLGSDGEFLPAGKYGLTPSVPAEDWAYVQKTYAECMFMQKKQIFAEASMQTGLNKAKACSNIVHGMEQADVYNRNKDSRLPKNKTEPMPKG